MSFIKKLILTFVFLISLTQVSIRATTYYSKSAGNLNVLATWGVNTNGSGASPANFTTAGNTFIIVNNAAPAISANWTVSGAGSGVQVGDGTQTISFTVTAGNTATAIFTVMVNSTLTLAFGAIISGTINVNGSFVSLDNGLSTFGTLAAGSTVTYSRAGNQTVADAAYSNLTLSGSGIKTLDNTINASVANTLTINSGITFKLPNANTLTLTLNGTITGAGTFTGANNSNLSIGGTGNFGTLNFTAGAQTLYGFTINRAASGIVTLGTALTVANNFTHTNGILNLNAQTLTLNGAITFPVSATNGSFSGSSTSSLSIGGAGAITNYMYMTQSGTSYYMSNITHNRTGQSLTLGNSLFLVGTLTPTAGTFAANGNLTLVATSAGVVARIATVGGSVTGNVNVQSYAKGGTTGWTHLGSAGITGRTFSDWNDNFYITCSTCPGGCCPGGIAFTSIYSYDETVGGLFSNTARYIPITNISDPMTIGKGFWTYLGNSTSTTTDIIFNVVGPVNQGNFSYNITMTNSGGGTNATDHGYNLLANPYPSPISWTALRAGNASVANAIYVYNPDLSGYASYVNGVSSPAVGSGGIGDFIPAGQAFYVKASAATSLTALESNKGASAQILLKTNGPQQTNSTVKPMVLHLKANGVSMQNETAVYFDGNATTNYEENFDAICMGTDGGFLSIATSMGGTDYSINGLPPLNQNFSIPVKVTTGTTGTYQIAATDIQNLPSGACVMLHDNNTNANQDLRSGPYSCTISSTETAARFVLNITINNFLTVTSSVNNPACSFSANGSIIASANSAGPWNYFWKDANNNVIKTRLNKSTADTLNALNRGNYSVDINTAGTCDNGTQNFTLQGTTVPNSSFNASASTVILLQDTVSVLFTNTSSNANTYWWDFGDGNGSSDINGVNYYASPGNYTVALTAYNAACGDSTVSTQVINVVDGTGSFGITAYAELTKNMFISRDEQGYYVQFNYKTQTNAVVTVQNILGEKVTGDLNEKNVSGEKIYIPLGNTENKILIISVVTESGEKTFCKVINY